MSVITLPHRDKCTGCGVCAVACTKSAISMQPDEMGVVYPVIDYDQCISCGKCQKVCHLNGQLFLKKSEIVYAA